MRSLQHGIWKSGIHTDTKLHLFKVYIFLVLLYGAETWTLTRALETKLDVSQRWCLIRILRIPFLAHVTKVDIYQRAVFEMLQCRRLQLFGHVVRCDVQQDHARALKAV